MADRLRPSLLGATQLDRARTIARGLLAELRDENPERAARAARLATQLEETWLTERPAAAPDEPMSTADVAYLAGVRPDTVYRWTKYGVYRDGRTVRLPRHPDGSYDQRHVDQFLALLRAGNPPSPRKEPHDPPATGPGHPVT